MEKRIENVWEKFRHTKKNQWLILILAGVLFLVVAMPIPEQDGQEETVSQPEVMQKEYTEKLEEKLENALCQVAGVGRVKVMLTRKSGGEKIVEKDSPVTSRTSEEAEEGKKSSTQESIKEETTVYEQDGKGGQTPYVIEEIEPQIRGVIVVAQGGGDAGVVRNITEAVEALFGVEAHKIKVMKMNSGGET